MSSAVPQADVATFRESGRFMNEPKKFPICSNHPEAEIAKLGTFQADREGVVAELSIFTCEACRPMKKSFGRKFRGKLCISAPGLDSFRDFSFERDFEFVSDIRAWTLSWQRGGLAYAFFDARDDNERQLLNRDQTFIFILADLAKELENEKLLEIYD